VVTSIEYYSVYNGTVGSIEDVVRINTDILIGSISYVSYIFEGRQLGDVALVLNK
jgi:hypothetical protein